MGEDRMFIVRVGLVAAVSMLSLTEQAYAAPKKLTTAEISAALTGNTLDGDWEGIAYRKYFDSSGQVIYVTPGGTPVYGVWHASDSDQLCETMPPSINESCYEILRAGTTIFWVMPETGLRRQAIIMTGKVLDFSVVSPN
jgi:hypothetical protein